MRLKYRAVTAMIYFSMAVIGGAIIVYNSEINVNTLCGFSLFLGAHVYHFSKGTGE